MDRERGRIAPHHVGFLRRLLKFPYCFSPHITGFGLSLYQRFPSFLFLPGGIHIFREETGVRFL